MDGAVMRASDGGRADVVQALRDLVAELKAGATWENRTLERFLDALAAWLDDAPGYYVNHRRDMPTDPWELLLDALQAAKIYE